jgi:pyruvate kinase
MNIKRTKIICTIGPSSADPKIISKLISAGMNVARMNMSHGEYGWHEKAIKNIRAMARRAKTTVGIIVDLQGPKIRVGALPEQGVKLVAGQTVVFSTDPNDKLPKYIPVGYKRLHEDVKRGDRMLFDDGLMDAVAVSVSGKRVSAKIGTGGTLKAHKGMNLPDSNVRESSVTAKDVADAKFALRVKANWVALSFVRSAEDVLKLRKILGKEKTAPKIIVKIEKPQAVANFDSILDAADAVMVARGDLGIEIPAEQVPVVQKTIIAKCLAKGRPVVVATQMLDSMIRNPRPTRAEVSDVANAVIDHADAVMLSGETASGEYPVEAAEMMAAVAQETEKSHFDDLPPDISISHESVRRSIAGAAAVLAEKINAAAILVATFSGASARYIARVRPEIPIYAAVPDEIAAGAVVLSWGVCPIIIPRKKNLQALIAAMRKKVTSRHLVKRGEKYVLVAGKWREKGEYVVETVEER